MTLVEFLTARLNEDEQWALGASAPLREVAAKRRIMELHRPIRVRATGSQAGTIEDCQMCDHFPAQYPCGTLRLLALPYADHPDYRSEWAA